MSRITNLLRTPQEWAESNPVLEAGQIGVEKLTGRKKIGNGTGSWSRLSYVVENKDLFDLISRITTLESLGGEPEGLVLRNVASDDLITMDPADQLFELAVVSGFAGYSAEGTIWAVVIDSVDGNTYINTNEETAPNSVFGQLFEVTGNTESAYPLTDLPLGLAWVANAVRDDSIVASSVSTYAGGGITIEPIGYGVVVVGLDTEVQLSESV